jgi:uncharacterized protein (TIGR00369 family)
VTAFANREIGRDVNRVTQVAMHEPSVPASPTETHVVGEVRTLDHLRGAGGSVRAGALLTMADTIGGMCAGLTALPGWVVSTNLMLRTVPGAHVGPLALESTVLRAGRKAIVTQVEIRDSGAGDVPVADGVLTSAVLEPEGGPPDFPRPMQLVPPVSDEPILPLLEFFSVGAHAQGVALPITDRVRNPWGILHGGATAVLVDAAGTHAIGEGAVTADVALHFMRPGRVGPAVARPTVVGERADGHVVRIEVVDAGADDRLMAVAVTTVRTA